MQWYYFNKRDESIVEIVDFDANLCSRVTSFNARLYYTDSNRSEVVCCDINGTILWTFTDTSVSKDQRSIAVDDYGNVYVVGPRSANAIVISADGKKHKQLLSKTDRLDNPWALHYEWKTRQLLVANSTECQLTYTTDRQKNISTCPQSCHPKHCTKSIPYSQGLRIIRICSNEQTTKKRNVI